MTQAEVGEMFGVSQKSIYKAFKRNNYKARVAVKRDQYKENNSTWKGDDATYAAFHYRVYSHKGRPKKCEVCGTEEPNRSYDWACVGDYRNINDYKRMCRSCHWRHDKIGNNFPNNTRKPNNSSKYVKKQL
jgi:hypothetical protein